MAILNQIGGISTGGLIGALEGPLSSLFGNKSGVQMFQYPSNLGNDPSRMHIVQFQIRNVIPRKFETTNEEELDNISIESFSSKISSTFKEKYTTQSPEIITTDIGKTTSFSSDGSDGINVNKNISAYLTPKTTKNAAIINLYMPDTLAMNYSQEYSTIELGGGLLTAGAAAYNAGNSIKEAYDKGGISGGFAAVAQSENLADIAAAASIFGGETAKNYSDLFLKTQAKAVNPQIQLLYRGVGLRNFSMEFVFTPKSKEEADQISAIINTFVYAASPSITGAGGMFFIPPSEFNINFLMAKTGNFSALSAMLQKAGNSIIPGLNLGNEISNYIGGNTGIENDRLYKVGSCILEEVSVDYAPNGWAAHENGAPVQTRLTLNFREIDIVTRNRLKSGEVR